MKLLSRVNALVLATLLIMGSCTACMAEPRIVGMTWEQEITADFAGWRLYVSDISGSNYSYVPNPIDPLIDLTFVYDPEVNEYSGSVVVEVPVGVPTTFYFVMTALDHLRNESDYSVEDDITIFIAPPTTTTSSSSTTTSIDGESPEPPYNLETVEIMVKLILRNSKVN